MSDMPKKGFTFDNSDEMYEEVLRLQHLVAAKDAEIERLKTRLRSTNQVLVACVGSDGPDTAEEAAKRAVAEIERLWDRIISLSKEVEPLKQENVRLQSNLAMVDAALHQALIW